MDPSDVDEFQTLIEAVRLARDKGIKAGMLKLKNIWPVPERAIKESTRQASKVLVPEMTREDTSTSSKKS